MPNRFARHSAHVLKVTRQGESTEHHFTLDQLLRQRAAIVRQSQRDAERLGAELDTVDEMIEACQLMGVTIPAKATPLERPLDTPPEMVRLQRPPLRKRLWAFLTRPRGFGA